MIKRAFAVILSAANLSVSFADTTLIKHSEWTTGNKQLYYKLSPRLTKEIQNTSQDERESILLRPSIDSAETSYEGRYVHTQIKSSFHMQVSGFYLESGSQFFEIRRQICIIPHQNTPVEQVNCFNSKDKVSITSDIDNSLDIDVDIYNLTPGKYIAEVQMFVEQIAIPSHMPISYSTLGNTVTFTVEQKPGA